MWRAAVALVATLSLPHLLRAAPCDVARIAAGAGFALAIFEDGSLWSWGQNVNGQLGTGATTPGPPYGIPLPGQVAGLEGVAAADGGIGHSIAALADGRVFCWGWNGHGQLGDGTTIDSPLPIQVPGLADIVDVAAGEDFSVAVTGAGAVWAWGANAQGQLGDGTLAPSATPVAVATSGVTRVSAHGGGRYTLAMKADRSLWGWGGNGAGQLGIGSLGDQVLPVRVLGPAMVGGFSAGRAHALSIAFVNSSVWVWGSNDNAALSQPLGVAYSDVPLRVTGPAPGLMGLAVAAGSSHSHVLTTTRSLWGWGEAQNGEMGNGTTPDFALDPVQTSGLGGVIEVVAGWGFVIARTATGLQAWGTGGYGELGDGTFTAHSLPGPVDLSPLDALPDDQGNILRLVRVGTDVEIAYPGASASAVRLYADASKGSLGVTTLGDGAPAGYTDLGAILRPGDDYYRLRGLSRCSATPGP